MVEKEKRRDNSLIGAAGVHYAAYKLTLKGMLALPTVRNTPGTDLIVTSRDGRQHANIQVKRRSTIERSSGSSAAPRNSRSAKTYLATTTTSSYFVPTELTITRLTMIQTRLTNLRDSCSPPKKQIVNCEAI